MFKLRENSAPSVHYGDAERGPQGVTPVEVGGVCVSLTTEGVWVAILSSRVN